MSRIGRKPIPLPSGVKVAMQGGKIDVQGPKGKLSLAIPRGISFEQKDGVLTALRETEDHRALHGLARALVANAVQGVTQGFKKDLDIVGVGYRAELKGKMVNFALGYSHPIEFPIPEGIQITVEKQPHLTVSGADRGRVGQVSADIRSLRPPDPYKQKGIRITGERLKKKAGKAGRAKPGAEPGTGSKGSLLNEGENSWQQIRSGNYRVTSTASGFTFACGLASRERLSGRAFACTARM